MGLNDVPPPTTGKQIQSFLGFCNFFRRYVPAMATIAAPLDSLRNLTHFHLNEVQLAAFSNLKGALLAAPVLAFPDFARPFGLATDASSVGLGVVLFQPAGPSFTSSPDKTSSIVAFFSRALNKSEQQYSTTKRELLAVVFGLQKCRYYLWGRRFTLFTDHRALSFLMTQRDASALLQRWFLEIMEFEFEIVHIPGITNILPDALSRFYPVPIRKSDQHNEPTLLGIRLQPEATSLLTTPPEEDRVSILAEAHSFGHLGAVSVVNRVKECGYFWPSLMKDAADHVAACASCQRYSVKRVGFHPLQPI